MGTITFSFTAKAKEVLDLMRSLPRSTPFSELGSQIFLSLLMSPEHFLNRCIDFSELKDDKRLLEEPIAFLMSVIYSKQRLFGMAVSPSVGVVLSDCHHSPGSIVTALAWLYITACYKKKDQISLEVITDAFGMGFYSEESQNKIWDCQKVALPGNDNLFNYPEFYKEIKQLIFEEV